MKGALAENHSRVERWQLEGIPEGWVSADWVCALLCFQLATCGSGQVHALYGPWFPSCATYIPLDDVKILTPAFLIAFSLQLLPRLALTFQKPP